MALISCSECSHEISDLASVCPHCGYPLGEQEAYEEEMRRLGRLFNEDWED